MHLLPGNRLLIHSQTRRCALRRGTPEKAQREMTRVSVWSRWVEQAFQACIKSRHSDWALAPEVRFQPVPPQQAAARKTIRMTGASAPEPTAASAKPEEDAPENTRLLE